MAKTISQLKIPARKVAKYIQMCCDANIVPFIKGSPGIGKSALVREYADKNKLLLIDERLSSSLPEDLKGLPHFRGKKAIFEPYDIFPLEGDPIPEGYNGWVLFLDEFNHASEDVMKASYKLILDRQVGSHKLHPKCKIIAAGNLSTDKAAVNKITTALQSRMVHLEMTLNHKDWLEDVAIKYNYDPRIIAYLNAYPHRLMDFDPDQKYRTYCCPRTWEFVNRLIQGKENIQDMLDLLQGTISIDSAVNFIAFTKVFGKVPSIKQIIADPRNTDVPDDIEIQWATVISLGNYILNITNNETTNAQYGVSKKHIGPIFKYVSNFNISFQLVFGLMASKNKVVHSNIRCQKMLTSWGNLWQEA